MNPPAKAPLFAPFRGWLVRPEWASRVVAGAYDSKTPEQRRAAIDSNPYSYFGVTRSKSDLDEDQHHTDDDLLDLGATTLSNILDAGAFAPTDHPAFYAYRLEHDGHAQTGVVGALLVDGLRDGRVLTHENVQPERAALLGRHLRVVGATSSPIALTHQVDATLANILARATVDAPDLDHVVEEVRHKVWALSPADSAAVGDRLADGTVFVTDGHHRSAAALVGQNTEPDSVAFQRTLAVLFPASQVRVEAFHRRAPDRNSRTVDELVAALATVGTIEEADSREAAAPRRRGEVGVYIDQTWWRLVFDSLERPSALAALDVERLRRDVIGHVLGVDELADNSDVDYVPGPVGIDELIARCDADGAIGFVMHPTHIEDLMAVATAGELMPPKSSYFAPKPRSGVFLRMLASGATSHLDPS